MQLNNIEDFIMRNLGCECTIETANYFNRISFKRYKTARYYLVKIIKELREAEALAIHLNVYRNNQYDGLTLLTKKGA